MLRNKGFQGPKRVYFGPRVSRKQKKFENVIEQNLLRIMLSTRASYDFFAKVAFKEIRGPPLKMSFLNISKTIKNV